MVACGFATAPSDAGVGARRAAGASASAPRRLAAHADMRHAARRLASSLATSPSGARMRARVGGRSPWRRAPPACASADRSFGAGAAGSGHDSGGRAAANAHGKDIGVPRIPRARVSADQRLDPRASATSSPAASPSRPWTSTPEPPRAAPRVPPRVPADASGPSFELFGDDSPPELFGDKSSASADSDALNADPNVFANAAASANGPSAPEPFATLRGEIRRVTFHNADNFYTVARVRVASADVASLPVGATAQGGPGGGEGSKYRKYKKRGRGGKGGAAAREATVTVVGHIPGAAEGTNLLMTGDWRDVEKWGTQFLLNATPKEVAPADEDAMLRYLAGGALPGVGKATAAKLVAHFGTDVFAAFDAPDAEVRLRACPGVGAKTAAKLARAWGDSRGRREAARFLEAHGVAPALAQRVAAAHGAETQARVTADPFGALTGIRGATFHRCDALAARLGKAPDAEQRLAAAVRRVLQHEAVSDGHVYAPWARLADGVARLVGPRQFRSLRPGALEAAADLLLRRGDVAVASARNVAARGEGDDGAEGPRRAFGEDEEETFAATAASAAAACDLAGDRAAFWRSVVVSTAALHDAEAAVALDIAARLRQPSREPDVPRVRRWLQAAAAKEGWRLLSPAQEAFLDLALREPICVLTGGPGTGKTFATHIAVRLWRAMGRKVLMCAPTGRAAQRLAEIATAGRRMSQPVQSSTIHRLLETRRGNGGPSGARGDDDDDVDGALGDENTLSYKGTFARDAASPLDADVVVVDESSMLDVPLCAALLDAVKPDAQLVFVGDADQLPSVGPGSVLRDVLLSRAVPAVQLRDVFRQAEQSGIVRAAHAINAGRMPEVPVRRWDAAAFALAPAAEAADAATRPSPTAAATKTHTEDWTGADCVWITLSDDSPAGYEGALESLFEGSLPALAGLDPARDVQVLTPFRRGPASTSQLNAFLQARLNPPARGKAETRVGDVTLREGDRVLQQRNDYTKEVFNGDLGTVTAVDGDGSVRVVFGAAASEAGGAAGDSAGGAASAGDEDAASVSPVARAVASLESGVGREVSYSRAESRDLLPAWALTVHKAQGSEYRAVVLCLANAHRPLLRRELVYTAASRAKEALIVLAPPSAMRVAVETVGNDRRCTTLARRLAPLAPEAPACPATAAVAAAADAAARKREAEDARGA